ncbi:hypothetical protein [Flavobacterium sp.]|uniref:hypothetical protein n=1 Tax=Flavobacterium sp. TaxID=239 RepID=UPI0026060390|nr:hypothetical protein [Flavobacterium sp.]
MKTIKILIVSMLIIMASSFKATVPQDVITEFESMLKKHFATYKANPRGKVTKLAGGWVNERFVSVENHKYDIEKTGTPTTPYSGYCDFTLKRVMTEFHDTKKEAQQDVNFIKSDLTIHRHYYTFQKGKWEVSRRQYKTKEGWNDCNETIKNGENAGETNVKGCWED